MINKMAHQQSRDIVASVSAVVIVMSAYNIELVTGNIEFVLIIALLASILFLLFQFLFKSKPAHAEHSSSVAASSLNVDSVKKKSPPKANLQTPTNSHVVPAPAKTSSTVSPDKPTQWSLQLLQDIDWKLFVELCAHYYESLGYLTKIASAGENKSVDIYIYKTNKPNKKFGIIKCKQWRKLVGINLVKALSTVQSDEKIPLAVFLSSSGFSKTSISFCEEKHLKLISGEQLLDQISKLPLNIQQELLTKAVQGDYTTPSCVKCNAKMVLDTNNKSDKQVWRCQHYPKCKSTMYLKANS